LVAVPGCGDVGTIIGLDNVKTLGELLTLEMQPLSVVVCG